MMQQRNALFQNQPVNIPRSIKQLVAATNEMLDDKKVGTRPTPLAFARMSGMPQDLSRDDAALECTDWVEVVNNSRANVD